MQKKDNSYHDFVVYDLMSRFSDISSRAMMGGWCIYKNKSPFAMIIENQLYLKASGEVADKLIKEGWEKFTYEKPNGKVFSMCYYLVPSEIIDSQNIFEETVENLLANLNI